MAGLFLMTRSSGPRLGLGLGLGLLTSRFQISWLKSGLWSDASVVDWPEVGTESGVEDREYRLPS